MPPVQGQFGNGCRHANDIQKSFVDYVRGLQADETLTGEDLVAWIRKDYPPLLMFQPTLVCNSALILKFAQFLQSRQVTIAVHQSNVLLNRLAATFFEGDLYEIAIGAISDYQQKAFSPGPASQTQVAAAPIQAPHEMSFDKLSYYISQRFRSDETRFSGALGECWIEYLSEYQYAARELRLTPTQKADLMHHLFRGNAKRFYIRNIEGKNLSYNEVIQIIEREFNSVSRQNRIVGYLRNLRINKFLGKNENLNDALEKVHEEISKLTPQGPEHNRSERHRIEYLRDSVIGHSWAREACSRATAGHLGYQEFYAQLEAAIQLQREEKIGRLRDEGSIKFDSFSGPNSGLENPSGTYYTGQSRYGRDPRRRNGRPNYGRGNNYPRKIVCFGCRKEGHIVLKCPERKNALNRAASRVQHLRRDYGKDQNGALKRVLYEICEQIAASDDEAEEAAETFFAEERMDMGGDQEEEEEKTPEVIEQLFTSASNEANKPPSLTNCLEDF